MVMDGADYAQKKKSHVSIYDRYAEKRRPTTANRVNELETQILTCTRYTRYSTFEYHRQRPPNRNLLFITVTCFHYVPKVQPSPDVNGPSKHKRSSPLLPAAAEEGGGSICRSCDPRPSGSWRWTWLSFPWLQTMCGSGQYNGM